jgi:hypothetical protein
MVSGNVEVDSTDGRNRKRKFALDDLPDVCPICHVAGEQINEDVAFTSGGHVHLTLRCPRKKCDAVYFGVYAIKRLVEDSRVASGAAYERSTPSNPEPYIVSDTLKSLSPRFSEIIGQAAAADGLGWTEIAGPGYRKALEFLIKDYLIKSKFAADSMKQDEVRKKKMLMHSIDMLEDGNIKSVATRATWLGNDETHYARRWTGKDLADLKALVRLTVLHVESDLQTQEYMKSMPDSGPPPT